MVHWTISLAFGQTLLTRQNYRQAILGASEASDPSVNEDGEYALTHIRRNPSLSALFYDVYADNGHPKWAFDAKDRELVGFLDGFLGLLGGLRLTRLLYCLLCFPLFPRGALAFLQRACCDFLCFGFLF